MSRLSAISVLYTTIDGTFLSRAGNEKFKIIIYNHLVTELERK